MPTWSPSPVPLALAHKAAAHRRPTSRETPDLVEAGTGIFESARKATNGLLEGGLRAFRTMVRRGTYYGLNQVSDVTPLASRDPSWN